MVDGTDPSSTSRRGIQLALARDIKLAEEERRRWEALRKRSLLQYAAAQPLPDEARPAAAAGLSPWHMLVAGASHACLLQHLPAQLLPDALRAAAADGIMTHTCLCMPAMCHVSRSVYSPLAHSLQGYSCVFVLQALK